MAAGAGTKLLPSPKIDASGFVEANGARLYYEVYNAKGAKALVVGHGAACKLPFLCHLYPLLIAEGYKVLTYESRGLGRSSCQPGPQTTSLLASDCLAVVDGVLGPTSPFYYTGLSLAGMVGQELLALLVRKKQTSRLQAAFLAVTSPGERWRPLPWRRARVVRNSWMSIFSYKDQADFEERFPQVLINMLYSPAWLDETDPASTSGAPRREAALALWLPHWKEMSAWPAESHDALVWQLTAVKSHFLRPRKAARIKASGMVVGVGVSTADAMFPAESQHLLAASLGGEAIDVCRGHCDCAYFDAVGGFMAGLKATFARANK